jgi:BlaI family penicillinase repressor
MSTPSLGPLEMQVLGILEQRQQCDVGEMQAALEQQGHEVAYTTVMTVLSRMHDKGIVSRKKEGRKFLYSYTKHSSKAKGGILKNIKARLFGNEKLAAVVSFLDQEEDLSQEDLKKLRKLIEQKIAAKGK